MKTQFVALLLFASFFCQGQDILLLQDPGNTYQLLDEGWHYKMGEHPKSVYADYNEEGWKPIRPGEDIHDSITADAKTGIGWMRVRYRLSREARSLPLAIMIHQSIASEIYMNGQIIKQLGTISEIPSNIKAFDPRYEPISLTFSNDSIQVIAIRFVVQPGIKYAAYYGATNPFFSARLMRNTNAIEKYKGIYMVPWLSLFMQGIIFMVFILHISFFLMYREQKANLLFALAALFGVIGSQFQNYYYYFATPDQKLFSAILANSLYALNHLLMYASVYIYLKVQRNASFWILAGILLFSILLSAGWYRNGFNFLGGTIPIVSYLFIIFLSVIALIKRKVKESLILIIGFSLSILSFIIFLINVVSSREDQLLNSPFNLYSFIFLFFLLCPPASVSIFLANDFARTSKRLQQKLDEVEILSEKNVNAEREKQEILASQNQELEVKVKERTAELNKSLIDRRTQAQLIQSEKMASLGELTAGIAHEIQNPLNFVNNFSEINTELIGEIKKEIKAGNYPEVEHLSNDLEANMEKITLHGKRADAIVKSMLQHSRASSGQKEPTDINALADEYLKLSYHGFRARDKSFNAALHTEFDESIGKIIIISQDIGRVLLNIYNNAFQAVAERKRDQPLGFDPRVTVSTKKLSDRVEIRIADNGNGIPEKILNKIFQPFFTTKPAGEGTGLGLSLSYDMVKSHGGEIEVKSTEDEGTTFIISLPG